VTLEQLPEGGRTALLSAATGGRVEEVGRIDSPTGVAYEADDVIGNKSWELTLLADGTISERELDDKEDEEDDDGKDQPGDDADNADSATAKPKR
jgi:hypothetical protein